MIFSFYGTRNQTGLRGTIFMAFLLECILNFWSCRAFPNHRLCTSPNSHIGTLFTFRIIGLNQGVTKTFICIRNISRLDSGSFCYDV